jgi:hypothetical protein
MIMPPGVSTPLFHDKNTRHIGKYQSTQPHREMETPAHHGEVHLAALERGGVRGTGEAAAALVAAPARLGRPGRQAHLRADAAVAEGSTQDVRAPVQKGYLLRRGGGQNRWHSLVNCNHGDSSSSRFRLTAHVRP